MSSHEPHQTAKQLRELSSLVGLALDQQLEETQRLRMQELVCSSPECCEFYVAAMTLHAALPANCGSASEDRVLLELLLQESIQVGTQEKSTAREGACAVDESLCSAIDALCASCQPGAESSTSFVTPVRSRKRWFAPISRPLPAVAFSMLLLMVTTVLASSSVRNILTQVLLPSRFTVAGNSGGLTYSKNPDHVLHGPNVETGTRRIGSSAFDDVALASLIVFPLPTLEDIEQIHSARLEWTLKQIDGSPEFDVDLYGLGYVESPELTGNGFWEGDFDDSLRAAYGMSGPGHRTVQLIQASVMTPATEPGRIRVRNSRLDTFIRSLYRDGAQAGDLVVFRLNANASTVAIPRSTGYEVVHPPAIDGVTEPAEIPMFWITPLSDAPQDLATGQLSLSAQSMTAHPSSGLTRSTGSRIETGSRVGGTRLIGSSMRDDQSLAVALMFTLPPIDVEVIEYASLDLTVLAPTGDCDFAVDLYGLGYTTKSTYTTPCFWEGDSDPSSAGKYGLLGPADEPVALIAKAVVTPDSHGRISIEGEALVEFLRTLYDHGAQGGDTVVFRLSADRSTRDMEGAHGYPVILPPRRSQVSPHSLPLLSITTR
ncbi:hypothetical protein [Aeoliella sp.]|uniref:hypothetical protein n=1 Tax=Aeoliella sp. TaxID=2795800 RepID=UPI003CCBC7C3